MSERQPIFNAPGVVLAMIGVFLAVFLAADPDYGLLPDRTGEWLRDLLALSRVRFGDGGGLYAGGELASVTQFVTHIFAHIDIGHLAINSAWLLAVGTPVARRLGAIRFLLFFLVCGVGGALLFLALNPGVAVGASGAIAGLMGATLRFLLVPPVDGDAPALPGETVWSPPLSLSQALLDRRVLVAIAAWTVLNFVVALAAPTLFGGLNIAWEAHLGGFFTGFLTFSLFDPHPPRSR